MRSVAQLGIKGSETCFYRRTVNVCAEVDLADVIVLEDGGISSVRSVVSGTVVQRAAGGKRQTGVQTVFLDQFPGTVLQFLTVGDK